jgi:hypothetical protein
MALEFGDYRDLILWHYPYHLRALHQHIDSLKQLETDARVSGWKPPAKKTKRRSPSKQKPRPLTGKQTQAMSLYLDTQNYSKVAEAMRISPKTAAEHVKVAFDKLGKKLPTATDTRQLPSDLRGQATVADADEGPAALRENHRAQKDRRKR